MRLLRQQSAATLMNTNATFHARLNDLNYPFRDRQEGKPKTGGKPLIVPFKRVCYRVVRAPKTNIKFRRGVNFLVIHTSKIPEGENRSPLSGDDVLRPRLPFSDCRRQLHDSPSMFSGGRGRVPYSSRRFRPDIDLVRYGGRRNRSIRN